MTKEPVAFLDAEDNSWALQVHVSNIKRARDTLGYMLTDLVQPDSDLFKEIATKGNPIPLVDILWLLCEEQAKRRDISEDQFAQLLGDGTLERAMPALLEAIVNFSRPSGSKTIMDLYRKTDEINTKNADLLQQAIDLGVIEKQYYANNPELLELARLVEEAKNGSPSTSGKKSSDSAESLESTPANATSPLKISSG